MARLRKSKAKSRLTGGIKKRHAKRVKKIKKIEKAGRKDFKRFLKKKK